MLHNPEPRLKKDVSHFHIDEETAGVVGIIKAKLIPLNTPMRTVDIIRAAVRYVGLEVAKRYKDTVDVEIYNVRNGSLDGNRMLITYEPDVSKRGQKADLTTAATVPSPENPFKEKETHVPAPAQEIIPSINAAATPEGYNVNYYDETGEENKEIGRTYVVTLRDFDIAQLENMIKKYPSVGDLNTALKIAITESTTYNALRDAQQKAVATHGQKMVKADGAPYGD